MSNNASYKTFDLTLIAGIEEDAEDWWEQDTEDWGEKEDGNEDEDNRERDEEVFDYPPVSVVLLVVFGLCLAIGVPIWYINNELFYHGFFEAVQRGTLEEVQSFIERGANVNAKCNDGLLTVQHAVCNPDVEILQYLVSRGANVHARDEWRATALHSAAWYSSNVEILEYLISQGLDVNARDIEGLTPLHDAARNADVEIVKYLVSQGAYVNERNATDWTPLHFAAGYNSDVEVLKYLIAQGANIKARTRGGWIPLDVANTEEKRGIIRLASGVSGSDL